MPTSMSVRLKGGSQAPAGLDVYGRLHKRKRKGVFGIHARRDARPSIPAAGISTIPAAKGWRFMVARLLNLTAADQHAEQFISRELD